MIVCDDMSVCRRIVCVVCGDDISACRRRRCSV